MSIIKTENICKSFGSVDVLKNVSLTVEPGEVVVIIGPSGAGKSTYLRSLNHLEKPTSGKIWIDDKLIEDRVNGHNQVKLPHKERAAILLEMGMVFQRFNLFPHKTALQNVMLAPMNVKGVPEKEAKEKAVKLLNQVGLGDKLDSYPAKLSGGQQQRVALARAIVTKPKVLLLDEPLSAIDAKLRKSLQIEIRRIQKELNITTIFVTHDQDEAMIMSDRICLLNEGRIEQLGKPIEIYTDPKTRFAAGFIGNYNVLGPAEFRLLTGLTPAAGDSIAIRPETIAISREKQNPAGSYEWEGTVLESRSRGNVLRYTILVNGIRIYADTLFRSFSIFEDGAKVYLSVEKRNCLPVADQASGAA